jgi:hypothetical protein
LVAHAELFEVLLGLRAFKFGNFVLNKYDDGTTVAFFWLFTTLFTSCLGFELLNERGNAKLSTTMGSRLATKHGKSNIKVTQIKKKYLDVCRLIFETKLVFKYSVYGLNKKNV